MIRQSMRQRNGFHKRRCDHDVVEIVKLNSGRVMRNRSTSLIWHREVRQYGSIYGRLPSSCSRQLALCHSLHLIEDVACAGGYASLLRFIILKPTLAVLILVYISSGGIRVHASTS